MRIFSLIPAAGKSVRMGRPKLELPLGGRLVLERVIDAFQSAGVTDTLVVLGPASAHLKAAVEHAGAKSLLLERDTPDMRATVLRGLDWLEERFHPDPADTFFLVPADHPTLVPAVLVALMQAAAAEEQRAETRATIWLPTFQGTRGHPALISWQHVDGMRKLPEGQGLNSYLRQRRAETQELPWTTDDILCDLDTPSDYERLLAQWNTVKQEE